MAWLAGRFLLLALSFIAIGGSLPAAAQDYPTRPITIVVPLSAVGPRPQPPVDLTLVLAVLANVMVGLIIALIASRYARR